MTKRADQLNLETEGANSRERELEEGVEQSVGGILRSAREEQGMDIGLLASSLKVSVRQLELLEANQYDGLPDMAFTRNFAISVARRLKVDDQLIAGLLPKIDNVSVVNSVIRMSPELKNAVMKNEVLTSRKRKSTWLLILIALVCIAIGVMFLLPLGRIVL